LWLLPIQNPESSKKGTEQKQNNVVGSSTWNDLPSELCLFPEPCHHVLFSS